MAKENLSFNKAQQHKIKAAYGTHEQKALSGKNQQHQNQKSRPLCHIIDLGLRISVCNEKLLAMGHVVFCLVFVERGHANKCISVGSSLKRVCKMFTMPWKVAVCSILDILSKA